MSKTTTLIIGVVIGIALPLLLDLFLFGTVTPCHTIKHYEDGSSVQACTVKE